MHNAQIKEMLETRFSEPEVGQIIAFLEEDGGFSPKGESVIVNFFIWTREAGKTLADALKVCVGEWEWNWSEQDSDIRGDREAPGDVGIKNYTSILNLHCKLGIPLPEEFK